MSAWARVGAWSERAAPWLAALALGLAASMPLSNSDTYGHIAAGREIVALGHVPSVDHFSLMFERPAPWRNHNWLSGLLMYGLDATTGPNGLIALSVLLSAASGVLLVRCARAALPGAAFVCATLVVASIPAIRERLSPRPHLFSLLFEAALLGALGAMCARPSIRPRALLLGGLGMMQMAWVNLHGSSPFGMVMTAIYLAAHVRVAPVRRELTWLLGVQLVASCVSPFGPALLLESVRHVADPGVANTLREWTAFDANDPPWYMGSLAVQGGLLLLAGFALRHFGPALFASYALAFLVWFMGLRSGRFVLDALLIGAPALAVGLTQLARGWPPQLRRGIALGSAALAVTLAPIVSAQLPPFLPIGAGEDRSALPAASGQWLARHHPRARIAGAIQDAWYMSYAVPQARVLIDGRVAVYGTEAFARVLRAFADPAAFMRLCEEYRIDAVVLQHALLAHQPALAALASAPDFKLVQLEDHHALFVRRSVAPEQTPFVRLHPGFGALAPEQDTSAELARLARVPNAQGYHAYHSALALLVPYLRARGHDGLQPELEPAGQAAIARALPLLRVASERLPDVPTVHVYHALVAAQQCLLPEARHALAIARASRESRETLLIAQEIALAERDSASVRAFLGQIGAVPALARDGWAAGLRDALEARPRCR